MKLSTKPRYAVRILAQIAVDTENGTPAVGHDVAEKQGISGAYMEQILIPLRNAGLINTVRGRHGGYLLARDPASITLLDILELFEGRLELVDSAKCDECQQLAVCPTTGIWGRLSEVLRQESAAITLKDVAEEIKASGDQPLSFVI